MPAQRLSPGVYLVNGKKVNAKTAAEAEKMGGGAKAQTKQGGGGGGGKTKQGGILGKNTNMKTVPGAIEAEKEVADYEAGQGIKYANPNQSGPFGSRTVDESGNVIDTLNPEGEAIRRSDDALTQYGRDVARDLGQRYDIGAGFNPQTINRFSQGDFEGERSRIENTIFSRLNQDTEKNRGLDLEARKQDLFNRGIAYSNDPNSRYQQELGDVNKRYDTLSENARKDATLQGFNEYQGTTGINEQTIANQLSQQQGIRNQQIGELGNFANFGQGLRVPNMGPVQGVQYNLPSPTDVYGQQQQINLAHQQLNRNRGGGGQPQGGAPATQSPFNNSLPPGVSMNQG